MAAAPEQGAIDALRAYVRAAAGDDGFLAQVLTEAAQLVATRTNGSTVPPVIVGLAVREVAADLYHRRRVRNGIANFDGDDLTPIRVTRDPMKAAAEILAPYLTPGIA